MNIKKKRGFTLIEILVVIGIIAILAAVVLVAVNPSRQFKLARDSQRVSNVNSILNAIGQNMAEHGGVFMCGMLQTQIPTQGSDMVGPASSQPNGFDIANCLVPAYISSLPFDPSVIGARYNGPSDYDTKYLVSQDVDGRVTVTATGEINQGQPIAVTR